MLQCYISLLAHADVRCFLTDVIFAIQNYLQRYRTDIIAKCIVNFLLMGLCSLQQLVSTTLILIFICRILCKLDCDMLNRWAVCLADFVGLQTTVAWNSVNWSSVMGSLSPLQMQPGSLNNLYLLHMDTFVSHALSNSIRNHLCTVTTHFDSWYQGIYLALCISVAIFLNCGDSVCGDTDWKLE